MRSSAGRRVGAGGASVLTRVQIISRMGKTPVAAMVKKAPSPKQRAARARLAKASKEASRIVAADPRKDFRAQVRIQLRK